jgi:osmotically-inducible protein OsmY
MTNSKLRLVIPLAIALATASAAAVADGQGESDGRSSDAKITTNVRALFDRHSELGPSNSITVQTRARVVYLYGEVSTGLEREKAESLAEEIPGVKRVVSSIFVSH